LIYNNRIIANLLRESVIILVIRHLAAHLNRPVTFKPTCDHGVSIAVCKETAMQVLSHGKYE